MGEGVPGEGFGDALESHWRCELALEISREEPITLWKTDKRATVRRSRGNTRLSLRRGYTMERVGFIDRNTVPGT